MNIEYRNLEEIIPYANNIKIHQVEWIMNCIRIGLPDNLSAEERHKYITDKLIDQPIVVDSHNIIIKGHGRLKAAQELGLMKFPVIVRKDLTEEEKRLIRIADNRTSEGGWESDNLTHEILSLQESIPTLDLDALGFIPQFLSINTSILIEPISETPLEEWKDMPEFEQEQLAYRSLHVHFKTAADIDTFCALIGQTISKKTRSIWFPAHE